MVRRFPQQYPSDYITATKRLLVCHLSVFETVTNDTPLRIDTGITIIDRKSA